MAVAAGSTATEVSNDIANACGDPARIAAFAPYDIVDTPREAEYDDLAQLAAQVCETPIAVINFVLADRQWFKAEVGLGLRETPMEVSICRHLLLTPGLTVIPDLRHDPRVSGNPLVAGATGLRFYAGHLLATPDGVPLGTLCVLDHRPRPGLAPEQRFALTALARQLTSQLGLRRALREQRRLVEQKELLFQELNHRIKNSLQIVASMMQLQAASLAGGGESQMVVTAARNRVLTIAELHDQLFHSGELREVEIGGYLQAMLASIVATVSQGADFLQARVEVGQSVSLSTDRAVSVALIVNELVTNAIKHARSDEAPLQVLVRVEPGEGGACCVTVEDNGGGLPADFDPNVGTSLGMRIVLALARQLQGSLTWNTGKHGVRFSLAVPPAYS